MEETDWMSVVLFLKDTLKSNIDSKDGRLK